MNSRILLAILAAILLIAATAVVRVPPFDWNPPWQSRAGMAGLGVVLAYCSYLAGKWTETERAP